MAQVILRPLTVPLLLLILVGSAVLVGMNRSAASERTVNDSQKRLTLLGSLTTDITTMENGERGYVITGKSAFLRPYTAGRQQFQQHASLLFQVSDIPLQQFNTHKLVRLVNIWSDEAAQPEIQARKTSLAAAAALVGDGSGLVKLERARQLLRDMNVNENIRLSRALENNQRTFGLVRLLTLGGLGLSALLLLLAARRTALTVTRRLSLLQEDARQVAAGHYDLPLTKPGVSELDDLAQQFQMMASAVQERENLLKQTSRTLEHTNRQLTRSNRELERFAYVASHDLQEPLRTIASYTELLGKRYHGQLDARADKYIAFTIGAAERLKRLIQDLLAFSRVHQGERTFAPVDTAALVAEGTGELSQRIQDIGASVQAGDAAPGSLPTVTGNRELLHHIFLNLLGNALKFRDPQRPPLVRIWASRENGAWVFHVQDNGIGIESQYHEKIFGVFQRLHGMDAFEGSGIGLAVTRSAVEQHGGQVWLDSTPGMGTTFHFLSARLKPPSLDGQLSATTLKKWTTATEVIPPTTLSTTSSGPRNIGRISSVAMSPLAHGKW